MTIFYYSFWLFKIVFLDLGMDEYLLSKIAASGYKKKYIAEQIGVTPEHFSKCIAGDRTLSRKKEQKLLSLLDVALKSA